MSVPARRTPGSDPPPWPHREPRPPSRSDRSGPSPPPATWSPARSSPSPSHVDTPPYARPPDCPQPRSADESVAPRAIPPRSSSQAAQRQTLRPHSGTTIAGGVATPSRTARKGRKVPGNRIESEIRKHLYSNTQQIPSIHIRRERCADADASNFSSRTGD